MSFVAHALLKPLSSEVLVETLGRLSRELAPHEKLHAELTKILRGADIPESEIVEGLAGIKAFLEPKSLKEKLERELGTSDPFSFKRVSFNENAFEAWAPVGLVVHVAPANAWSVGFLSVVEGLLAGNANILKLASRESDFANHLLNRLGELEGSGAVAARVKTVRVPSRDRAAMKELLSEADAVAAWGGEEAIRSLRELTPEGARFVDWGPKISFAYFTAGGVNDTELEGLARSMCEGDQQACSAPQCVYLETQNETELKTFAQQLARVLERIAPQIPARTPDRAERSEITVVTRMQELKRALGEGDVIAAEGWRLLIDPKSSPRPSPLYRSLWVKPIQRENLVATLRPLRRYLQTAGVAATPGETVALMNLMSVAGVLRVTTVAGMMGSYEGEPHDGVFALTRYTKRVSLQGDERFKSIGRLAELAPPTHVTPNGPLMDKSDFQAMVVPDELAPLTFRSGGSSGDPKFSRFTYNDYHRQMQLAGFGLLAAGLEPLKDRCMNLFFGGGLYGGFISFFTILEQLRATQFPMAALADHQAVGESIVTHRVDTLLGMPSYLIQLFAANDELFRQHRLIKKVFYGGEHFQESQKKHLADTYGVELIKSAAYGSVDAGPLGYQCAQQSGSHHHLHHDSHIFEVLALESDTPATEGRLVVTTLMREGQSIRRYDLGDLVRALPGECACGRQGLRVELLGRHGDVVRVGASFFNYARMARILSEELHYSGEWQLRILPRLTTHKETLVLVLDDKTNLTDTEIERVLSALEPDFHEAVVIDKVLDWRVERVASEKMARVPGSGKLKHIIDERQS